jgi:Integrase core domain
VLQEQLGPRHVRFTDAQRRRLAGKAQQLREAWPWDTAPRFVIRDRDGVYGSDARRTAQQLGIDEVVTAPRSPWQNPFVERVIGSLRRECLDHVIVWNDRSLRRHLQRYLVYYHEWRTHLSLDKVASVPRAAQPPACGTIVPISHVGGFASPLRTSRRLTVALASLTWPYSPVVPPLCVHTAPQSSTEMAHVGFEVLKLRVGDLETRHRRLLTAPMEFLVQSL